MKRGNESKPHIGIFGRCNAGKSTLLNFLSAESASIVSSHSGTTTDPVKRSMEILDFAPVVMIDTAGMDDMTELGIERRGKTIETLYVVDLAILVYIDNWGEYEDELLLLIKQQGIPFIVVKNTRLNKSLVIENGEVVVNLMKGMEEDRNEILNLIKNTLPEYSYAISSMFGETVSKSDVIVLVCPIDSEAPVGRLILPQVQAIRDLLNKNAISVVIQPEQLSEILILIPNVKLVVTDSQVVDSVRMMVNGRVDLTTFSILLAALKGDMPLFKKGLNKVDELKDGDRVLMLESCSHQTSCEDIGRVKIPMWLRSYSQKKLHFDYITKLSALPNDFSNYALAIQCGGCMVTRRQVLGRIYRLSSAGVPITNYGMLISKIRK